MPDPNCPTCKGLGGYPSCPDCRNKTSEKALAPLAGSVAIKAARKHRLNQGIAALGRWAIARSLLEHDERTTMSMLRRKVDELAYAVNRAGWRVADESDTTPNTKSSEPAPRAHDRRMGDDAGSL